MARWLPYRAGVTSADLKPEQVQALQQTLARQLRYLHRLCARMQRLRFPLDDPLVKTAMHAREAVQALHNRATDLNRQRVNSPA